MIFQNDSGSPSFLHSPSFSNSASPATFRKVPSLLSKKSYLFVGAKANESMETNETKGCQDSDTISCPEILLKVVEKAPSKFFLERLSKEIFSMMHFERLLTSLGYDSAEAPKIKDLGGEIYEIFGNFKELYEECEELGQGVSAVVKRCVCLSTKEEFAVKIVNTGGDEELELLVRDSIEWTFSHNILQKIKREFTHRRAIHHKNVVSVYKLYVDRLKNKIYTVMELVKGSEMLEFISRKGHYSGINSILIILILLALHCNFQKAKPRIFSDNFCMQFNFYIGMALSIETSNHTISS